MEQKNLNSGLGGYQRLGNDGYSLEYPRNFLLSGEQLDSIFEGDVFE